MNKLVEENKYLNKLKISG